MNRFPAEALYSTLCKWIQAVNSWVSLSDIIVILHTITMYPFDKATKPLLTKHCCLVVTATYITKLVFTSLSFFFFFFFNWAITRSKTWDFPNHLFPNTQPQYWHLINSKCTWRTHQSPMGLITSLSIPWTFVRTTVSSTDANVTQRGARRVMIWCREMKMCFCPNQIFLIRHRSLS